MDSELVSTNVPQELEATKVSPARQVRGKSLWREVLETVLLTLMVFLMVKSLTQNFRIEGRSMEPNYHTNQMVMVNKAAYFHFDSTAFSRLLPWSNPNDKANMLWVFGGPQRGDVVVLEPPDAPTDDYIKRVIGLPGEKVEVKGGVVYINDEPLPEKYIQDKPFSPYGPVIVPANSLFVMGDNRNASRDSRSFGFLPVDKIVGKAQFIYAPFGEGWGWIS